MFAFFKDSISFRAWHSLSLQTRFMVGLVAAALGLGLLFFSILYFHMQSIVIKEVRDRSNIMLTQVNAVQSYVRSVLRPTMYTELADERFVLQAMSSSYVSRKVMEATGEKTDFLYRRVAINARNPKSEPNPRELNIIQLFQKRPQRSRWEKMVDLNGKQYYLCARPVKFTESCMRCHGHPSQAPKELIERYGSKRGFFHSQDTVAGLVSIGFPVQQTVNSIKEATFRYIFLYLVAVLLFFSIVHMHFRRVVLFNLRRLTSIFQRNFPEHQAKQMPLKEDHDEVDALVHGFEQLTQDLFTAREQLKDYAGNLEHMVKDRTQDLNIEATERQADVYLFVHILGALRSSRDSRQLLHQTLSLIGHRFRAKGVCYYCTQFSNHIYTWPPEAPHPELPQDFLDMALASRVQYTDQGVFIPVQSQEQVWGVLFLDIDPETQPKRASDQVLLALGQQMAIAMENIQTFHSLMHQKELLESIFEGISDPLMLVDHNARVVLANDAAHRLMQDETQDEVSQELFPVLGLQAKDKSMAPLLVSDSLANKEPWSQEVRLSNNRYFGINIYPIVGDHQPRGLAVCSLREVTAERRMMHQLQQAEKLSAVGKLAAGLAHEINNPLGTILCYVNLLKGSVQQEQAIEDLQVIERHTKRAQKILQDLLNFARPKAAGSGQCALNALIRNSVQFFQVEADKKQVELIMELDEQDPVVWCSEMVLEQILSNLLLNALEAVPESGRIHIRSRVDADQGVVLQVEDNGSGISDEVVHSIFDPFFSTKEVGQGTGLGLAIVYGLVQDVGGSIQVDNTPGACFTVVFQAQEEE